MYSVSAKFENAVRHGVHRAWIVRADVTEFGEIVAEDIPVVGGSVSVDSTAAVRRRATLMIAATDEMVPGLPTDFLFPVGRELVVRAGFQYDDGTEELVPQGTFRIAKPALTDNGDVIALQVDAYDRSRAVSRARFTEAYVIPEGTNYATAIKALTQRAIPWLGEDDFVFMPTTWITPLLVFDVSDDPWTVATNMARSLGAVTHFNQDGKQVLHPEPDPIATPSQWDYVEGEDANVVEVLKDLDDDGAYNGVIVTGASVNNAVPPVRAEAWDIDPASPTYYDPTKPEASLYGPVPYFMDSQYVVTTQQASDAAQGNLSRVLGVLEQVDFSATPNPAHEGGDVVHIKRAQAKIDDIHIIDSFTIPLSFGSAMQGNTRKRRVQ